MFALAFLDLLFGLVHGCLCAKDDIKLGGGVKAAIYEYYESYRDEAWQQYQLATGARAATEGESFEGGVPQGLTVGFDEEVSAGLNSLFDERSYEEIIEVQRQILRQRRISNPGAFLGGEVAGALPTVLLPVGGAAASAARSGQGLRGTMIAGGQTGAIAGGVSGFGHSEGGFVNRLGGAAVGAVSAGMGGALLSGAGVLIARGVSRTRIWGRLLQWHEKRLLINELRAKGVRHTSEDIVRIERLPDDRIVFLERGSETADLRHIMAHADDFTNKGIAADDLPNFIMQNLREGNIVGYQGKGTGRPIYETSWGGETHRTAITTGSNGFIVGANPVSGL